MAEIKHIVKDSDGKLPTYAWPGGYPMFYVDCKNGVACPDCANEKDNLAGITHFDINYEDDSLYCDYCNKRIESAYGEEDKEVNDVL